MILIILQLLLWSAASVEAESEIGCYSSLPSGSDSQGSYTWQSSSYCAGQCSGYDYFALYDGSYCYCLNSKPSGDTVDTCTVACTGYGQANCGGEDSYLVYSLDDDDSTDTTSSDTDTDTDTAAAQSSATTPTTTAATSTQDTTTTTSSSSSSTSTTSTTSSSSTSSADTTTSTAASATGAVTSLVTQSTNGATSVVTVTTTPTADAASSSAKTSKSSSNKGAIIGGAVGGTVAGLALIALTVFVVWFIKRRHSSDDESVGSFVDDAIYDEAAKRQPPPNPFDSPEDYNMNVDQRLNPIELGNRRLSEGSLADHADYSRKILRVANPDDNV